jgi:hypothetical protein
VRLSEAQRSYLESARREPFPVSWKTPTSTRKCLERLASMGFLVLHTGKRMNRRYYKITPAGRRALEGGGDSNG